MNRSPMPQRKAPLSRGAGLARGTGLEGGGALVRSVPLRAVSAKRRAENRERRKMAAELFPDRPLCAVYVLYQCDPGAVPGEVIARCGRWADDLHEPLTRARGGGIVDPANTACPCRPCHDILTFRPESELGWAYSAGLLIHSWDAPRGGDAA